MAGIGLVLNAAKDALLTNQYAMDVIAHNITNVNTEGYSRQIPVIQAKMPSQYGGFIFGRSIELAGILRESDNFVETRLRERKSEFMAMDEKEKYMTVLEGIFNENSERGLSAQFDSFWNAWHDLSNNPSSTSERNILYETSSLLSQSFSGIYNDMLRIDRELDLAVDAGVQKINELTSQLATLNDQIVNLETNGEANDLRDQRNVLVNKLSGYININACEDDEGCINVTTSGGYSLVNKTETYELSFAEGKVKWEGSGGNKVDITDKVTGGKLGGWLDMGDEIIPKYKDELDELAHSFIWEVNKVHSQGVGLEGFTSVTGTYSADTTQAIGASSSGLPYYDEIIDGGTFKIWEYDSVTDTYSSRTITVDTSEDLTQVATRITGGNVTASVSNNRLKIDSNNASRYTFYFSDDSSNLLAALGINTFFSGSDSLSMEMNSTLDSKMEFIAAALADSTTGEFSAGDNSNALLMMDLQYEEVDINRWTYERGSTATSQSTTDSFENYFHYMVGSVGIKSQSIIRERQYNEEIVNQLSEKRDSISATSLDEEMTNLIMYQHGYSAAAKLVTTADEMLKTLLEVKG